MYMGSRSYLLDLNIPLKKIRKVIEITKLKRYPKVSRVHVSEMFMACCRYFAFS